MLNVYLSINSIYIKYIYLSLLEQVHPQHRTLVLLTASTGLNVMLNVVVLGGAGVSVAMAAYGKYLAVGNLVNQVRLDYVCVASI